MRHTYRRGQKLEVQGDIQDYSCARDLKQRLVDFKFKLLNSKLLNCMWLSQALTGPLPVFLWLSMALCDSYSGSHWLSLPLSGSLLLSNFDYTVLDRLSGPLLGSQFRCHADSLYPGLIKRKDYQKDHFLPNSGFLNFLVSE